MQDIDLTTALMHEALHLAACEKTKVPVPAVVVEGPPENFRKAYVVTPEHNQPELYAVLGLAPLIGDTPPSIDDLELIPDPDEVPSALLWLFQNWFDLRDRAKELYAVLQPLESGTAYLLDPLGDPVYRTLESEDKLKADVQATKCRICPGRSTCDHPVLLDN